MSEPVPTPLLSTTWAELKRRRVVRAALAYAIVAWVVLQLAEITYGPLGLPGWALTWTILAAILGFPVVMVVAWYFDATASGFARDERAPLRKGSARLFAVAVVLLTTAALGVWLARTYRFDDRKVASDVPPNSIAVLPFTDMSAEHDQRWFADGIAEELLDRLARIQGLRVAARTSSFAFRERVADMREIGAALNVAYVLEGSVRKAGGRLRVTAQLIEAREGFHLWSQTYERPEQDIFALQDEVTAAIAEQLRKRITGLAQPGGDTANGTSAQSALDVRAHELYLQGRDAWRQRTPAALAQAREHFQRAVEIQPDFARAWSGLADAYLLEADYGAREATEAVTLAEPAAVRAVSLDPESAEAWATLGLLRMTAGQYAGAKANLERAIALDPDYTMASMWLSQALGVEGLFVRQREVLEQAHRISPLEPVIAYNLASTLSASGETQAAARVLREVLRVLPAESMLLRAWAALEAERGALDRAASAAHAAFRADPQSPANREAVIEAEIDLEDFEQAQRWAEGLVQPRKRAITLQWIALRRGERTLTSEFEALAAEALAGSGNAPPQAREVLHVYAVAKFESEPAAAARALARIVGDPERLRTEVDLADAASALTVALDRTGDKTEAARWRAAVTSNTLRWLDSAPQSARFSYVRALLAADRGEPAAAIAELETAYRLGFRDRWLLASDPRLANVRAQPGFRALEQRIARDLAAMRARVDRDAPIDLAVPSG